MKLKLACVVGFCLLALILGGGSPPPWVMQSEVLIVLTFAGVYGFTAFSPKLPAVLKCRELQGVILVAFGCVALFVPTQFIVSACLVGLGARLVMNSDKPTLTARAVDRPVITATATTPIARENRDIAVR